MKSTLAAVSTLALSICLVARGDSQTLVSDLDPKGEVNFEISSVDIFQQELDLYGPQIGLVPQSSHNGNPRINMRISDTRTGLTFVASSGELSLKRIEESPSGQLQYLATIKDSWTGRARTISQSDITLLDQNSDEVSFKLTPFTSTQLPASVVVALDSSASMNGYMPQVIEAANHLFDALPEQLHCRALVFGSGFSWYGSGESNCTSEALSIPSISAAGGTELFTAMTSAYLRLNAREDDVLKTLIVLTDGAPTDDDKRFGTLAAKGEVQTIFLWLGDKSIDAETQFAAFADAYVDDPDGAWRHLESYFAVYSDALNKQSIISVVKPRP